MTFEQVINLLRNGEGSEDTWLLITGPDEELGLETETELAPIDIDEENDFAEILPEGFAERGLRSTIDYETLMGCISYADKLSEKKDNGAALEIVRYYLRFDSVPETLGALDPPPREEILLAIDRDFYESLGVEREGTQCRREGCSRGAIQFSVFCRLHHFENVKAKPCPFSD